MSESCVIVNGERWPREAPSIGALLRELGHDPARQGIAVAINDEVVPRSAWAGHPVNFGDRVEIVGAVQGG